MVQIVKGTFVKPENLRYVIHYCFQSTWLSFVCVCVCVCVYVCVWTIWTCDVTIQLQLSSGGAARCEDEESLCQEPVDPKLTQPAPPSYSDAIELAQIPPPSYSAEFEGGRQANAADSQHELASSSFDLNNCSPPAYASVVASDSLPPSSSSITNVWDVLQGSRSFVYVYLYILSPRFQTLRCKFSFFF